MYVCFAENVSVHLDLLLISRNPPIFASSFHAWNIVRRGKDGPGDIVWDICLEDPDSLLCRCLLNYLFLPSFSPPIYSIVNLWQKQRTESSLHSRKIAESTLNFNNYQHYHTYFGRLFFFHIFISDLCSYINLCGFHLGPVQDTK